ncbi:MAG: hypothetical protein ACK5YA_00940, partial [bacterium]
MISKSNDAEFFHKTSNLDYLFNFKQDINSIISSSDELKKSEAIAEGLSLLTNKIIILEKINEELSVKYHNLRYDSDKLLSNHESLQRDYYQIKSENEYLNKEI